MAETTENPMDAVNRIVSGAAKPGEAQPRWLVCPKCFQVHQHDMRFPPPSNCVKCGGLVSFRVMPTEERAQLVADSLRQIVPQTISPGQTIYTNPPAVEAPAPANPPSFSTATAAPAAAPSEPAGLIEKKTRTRRPKVVEPVAPDDVATAAQAHEGVATHTSDSPAVEQAGGDWRARREAATAALIAKHQLNSVEWKEVATARCFTLGYTVWTEDEHGNRLPTYSFFEPGIDSPESFKAELDQAHREDSRVCVDAARIYQLPADVAACTFGGELVAKTRTPNGPVRVIPNDRVKIAAQVTPKGRLIWMVTSATR